MSAAYQNLFDYMYDEYGVILLHNEIQEIVRRVKLDEEQDNCNLPHVINNEAEVSSEGVAVCFNYKCPFDMNNEGVCAYGSTKCTAKQTDL